MNNFTKMANHPLIQDEWVPKVGDKAAPNIASESGVIVERRLVNVNKPHYIYRLYECFGFWKQGELIYLPGIRQLMRTVDDITLGKRPRDFCVAYTDINKAFYGETEQEALIQAVMYEKHKLKWNGERWE